MKKIYLACPYSHKDRHIELTRFATANSVAAKLMLKGHIVFSPLSHSVPIAEHIPDSNNGHDLWLEQDFVFVDWAEAIYVLCLPGWKKSTGVTAEIKRAQSQNKPIHYINEVCKELHYG